MGPLFLEGREREGRREARERECWREDLLLEGAVGCLGRGFLGKLHTENIHIARREKLALCRVMEVRGTFFGPNIINVLFNTCQRPGY